ncbi:hypothetical protein [Candidatus Rariloculus sp.]|uniref:hypothetical protein n=1 Tax=Candidatus Rariloculus sp. TaxID=3101265 RepID=UPI003D0F586C
MTYFAYLDEFGHIGPYVSRADPRYNESPVFGLAGFVLPSKEVRGFGTWFFQRKCDLLAFEIDRSGEHPAVWEKKGASLYTVTNVSRYGELRKFTNRLLKQDKELRRFRVLRRCLQNRRAGSAQSESALRKGVSGGDQAD